MDLIELYSVTALIMAIFMLGWLFSRLDLVLYIKRAKDGKYEYIREKEEEKKTS